MAVPDVGPLDASTPPDEADHEAIGGNVTRIDRLIRKSINETARDAGRRQVADDGRVPANFLRGRSGTNGENVTTID